MIKLLALYFALSHASVQLIPILYLLLILQPFFLLHTCITTDSQPIYHITPSILTHSRTFHILHRHDATVQLLQCTFLLLVI